MQSADSRRVASSSTRLDDTCLGSPGHPPCTGVFTSGVLSRALPKKYLLLDDRNIISSNATLALGKVTKHKAGALIKEDKPWEMRKSHDHRWHLGCILPRVPAVSLRAGFDNMQRKCSRSLCVFFGKLKESACTASVWYDPVPQPGRKRWRAWYSSFTTCSKPKAEVPCKIVKLSRFACPSR